MKRSILTEKVARRGYHLTREYAVDPLELVTVKEVMTTEVVTISFSMRVKELLTQYFDDGGISRHQGYPVVDEQGRLIGIVTRSTLVAQLASAAVDLLVVADILEGQPLTIVPDETCRSAAERMAQSRVGRLPVVALDDPQKLVGIVTLTDLLKARARYIEEEQRRDRFISPRLTWRRRGPGASGTPAAAV
jgi:CBS domain-containing protein